MIKYLLHVLKCCLKRKTLLINVIGILEFGNSIKLFKTIPRWMENVTHPITIQTSY
jgi:hypothetical protein